MSVAGAAVIAGGGAGAVIVFWLAAGASGIEGAENAVLEAGDEVGAAPPVASDLVVDIAEEDSDRLAVTDAVFWMTEDEAVDALPRDPRSVLDIIRYLDN
jgi:hypothetical protein